MKFEDYKFRAWDGEILHYNVIPWRWDFVIQLNWHKCEKSTGPGVFGMGGAYAEMLVPAIRFKKIDQFTGLLDKNKKEIYENDILLYPAKVREACDLGTFDVFYVKFENGRFVMNDSRDDLFSWNEDCEVIGNMHQNVDMLLSFLQE